MEFTFEDLGVKPDSGNGGGKFKKMTPPTDEVKNDKGEVVSLHISGWVSGVKLVDYSYDKDNAIFTFQDKTGGTIRKYIQDPLVKNHIINMDDSNPKKKEMIGYTYTEVMSLFKNFLKPFVVDSAVRGLKAITLENISAELYKLLADEDNLSNQNGDISLKLAFQHESGVEPKYIVPQNKYIGNEKYPPAWKLDNKDAKWNDKMDFKFEEKTDNFSTPPTIGITPPPLSGIDEVFNLNTPTVNPLQ